MSTIASWLRRSTDDLGHAAYLVLVSAGMVLYLVRSSGGGASVARALGTGAQILLALGAAAWALRAISWRRISAAASLVAPAAALTGWLTADRIHSVLFGAHLEPGRLALLYRAVHQHGLKLDPASVAAFFAVVAVEALLLRALVVALTFLPQRTALAARLARWRGPVLAGLALWVAFGPRESGRETLAAALPWGSSAGDAGSTTEAGSVDDPFGATAERRMWTALQRDRQKLLGSPLSAARRPSIVIVHAESVRFDMLREDVMPNTLRLSRECLSTSRHYSTSNNTGSSMFGILNAMPVSYYPLVRRDAAKPLPLQVLKKLGYSLSAYYSSYLSAFDGLCDLYFDGVVDRVHEERQQAIEQADAALVDAYVAEVASRDPHQPTFDYVVLESSHFAYAYPPAFERFTPTAQLGIGVGLLDPAAITRDDIPIAPLMRNRYQNSVVWVDSLVERLVQAWASRKDDVIFVVTGDHGESFWEHRAMGHGSALVDEELRVPLVMCIPGVDRTRYRYSSHADIFPTIFEFVGLGGSDVPFMAGKSLIGYDASRDVAVVGYGLTGSQSDDRLGVEGDGLQVVFRNASPFATISVARDGSELAAPFPADVEALVADLKLRAAAARTLR